jgi:hypothetical protein
MSLPGSYLGKEIEKHNPGKGFLRLAVVHDIETVIKAFSAVNITLQDFK